MQDDRDPRGRAVTVPVQPGEAATPEDNPEPACLMIIEAGSSALMELPASGELTIGRAPEVQVRLQDPSVSRFHARLLLQEGSTTLIDLGSQNGTRVNGERLTAIRPLASGDVITLCEATLLYHHPQRSGRARPVFDDLQPLRGRLEEEVERTRVSRRSVALLCLDLGEPAAERRREVEERLTKVASLIDVLAWAGLGKLLVIRPDCDEQDAQAAAEHFLSALSPWFAGARAGFTSSPADGYDINALLDGAQAAAEQSPKGQCLAATAAVTTLWLGDRPIVVADKTMLQLYSLIKRLALSDIPVLITGETGSGKEIAAQLLHACSVRKSQRLLTLNCAAVAESLAESELFGHERGAFSGAVAAKQGLFEAANGGTVFLDEVGELSPALQAKLLRVLEAKRITRVGDVRERAIDIRLVAATNRDLDQEVKKGRFRQDLLFRLNTAVLVLPPLRDRPRELPMLARNFLGEACRRAGREPILIPLSTMDLLLRHRWPGNIRELRNAMDYAATITSEAVLQPEHLPKSIREATPVRVVQHPTFESASLIQLARALLRMAIPNKLEAMEEVLIREALTMVSGNKSAAARLLGVHRKAVERRLDRKPEDE